LRVGCVVFIIVVQFIIVVFEVGIKRHSFYETKKGCFVILRQQMFESNFFRVHQLCSFFPLAQFLLYSCSINMKKVMEVRAAS